MSDVVHYSEMVRTACGLKDWDFGSMDWVHVTCLDCLRAELRRYQAIEKAAEEMARQLKAFRTLAARVESCAGIWGLDDDDALEAYRKAKEAK